MGTCVLSPHESPATCRPQHRQSYLSVAHRPCDFLCARSPVLAQVRGGHEGHRILPGTTRAVCDTHPHFGGKKSFFIIF